MHPKLAAALAAIPPPTTEGEALRTAFARGLMTGYHHRWIGEDWTVESIEQEFHIPIFNPASHRRSPRYTHAGKFDGIVSKNGDPYLLEHKTCREEIGPGSPYKARLEHLWGFSEFTGEAELLVGLRRETHVAVHAT